MQRVWRWLRSFAFVIQMYVMMGVMGLLFAPWAALTRDGAYRGTRLYCRWVLWTARWMVGLRTEVRGAVPSGDVLIAAKHQSFLDILVLLSVLPRARFIMKRELLWAPVLGLYARRIGCVPVDRGRGSAAMAAMVRDVLAEADRPGQLVIYPQGTRVAPGVAAPYKPGTGALYKALAQPCVPVATNVGRFWPRKGMMRRPGLGVVAFLPPIPPGRPPREMMAELEEVIETASAALLAEAGVP